MEIKNDSFDDLVDDFIAHYGVQGMKWGVRKERKTSGRAKRAKARLAKLAKSSASATKGAYQRLKKIKHQRDLDKVDAKLLNKKRLNRKDISKLSDKELQDAINRENKRSQLASMNEGKLKKFARDLGDVMGSAAKSTATSFLTAKGKDFVDKVMKTGKYDPDTILLNTLNRKKNEKALADLEKGKRSISEIMADIGKRPLDEDEAARASKYLNNVRNIAGTKKS